MVNRFLWPTLVLLLVAVPCGGEPEADIENAPTPLSLTELLPPGGIEAVQAEFWMRIEASYKDRPMDVRFIHWHIRPVDGQLACTLESGTRDNKLHSISTMTYSKQGKLTAFRSDAHLQGRKTSTTVGEVVDGQLVMKVTSYNAAGKGTTQPQTRSLQAFEETVPSEWFTIVAAYHIRKGNLGYSFARTDTAYRFQHAQTSIEDVGTEEVQWGGETHTAHMLLGERVFGKRKPDKPDSKLQYLLLPNGEMMYMRNLYHNYKFLGYRASKKDIAKEFWLPPAVEPKAEDKPAP